MGSVGRYGGDKSEEGVDRWCWVGGGWQLGALQKAAGRRCSLSAPSGLVSALGADAADDFSFAVIDRRRGAVAAHDALAHVDLVGYIECLEVCRDCGKLLVSRCPIECVEHDALHDLYKLCLHGLCIAILTKCVCTRLHTCQVVKLLSFHQAKSVNNLYIIT